MNSPGQAAVEHEYENRSSTLFGYASVNGLATANDVFARAASQGRYSTDELVTRVRQLHASGQHDELRTLLHSLRTGPLWQLLSLMANQSQNPHAVVDAAAVLEAMAAHGGRGMLRRSEKLILLDLLSTQARAADLEHYIDALGMGREGFPQLPLLRLNATNPFITGREDLLSTGVAPWFELLGWVHVREGLEPISLAPGNEPPLDRLLCAPSSLVDEGPLVTVIVPTHNPGPMLQTALESLLAQSYRQLQILVMDDASRPELARSLDSWEARDPRISVVHLARNGGTYRARNLAVARYARGDYVTVHDDDDWSHPRKIELQVAHLEAERDIPANMSRTVRMTSNLELHRRLPEAVFVHASFSSLMVRRATLHRLGYWDETNRAADGELRHRIVADWGHPVPTIGRAPMSILRARRGSLSDEEISKGYIDPRRRLYGLSYRCWHKQVLASGEVPCLPLESDARRFPAPVDMLGPRVKGRPTEVDILYGTDYRFPGGNSTLACNEIGMLLARGYTIGLMQVDSPVLSSRSPLHPRAFDLAAHPNARLLTPLDEVTARLTIVRHPTVLQFVEPARIPVSTPGVVLIVNHAPVNPDGKGAYYDIATVVANCEAMFGRTPVVAPESGLMRSLLAGRLDPVLIAAEDWNGVVAVSGSARPRQADPSRPPVLGRHSRDHLGKWPSADDLPLAYPLDGSRDVRVLGGAEFAQRRLGRPVDAVWTVYPFGSKPAAEFLDELDFWAYFHGQELYESFGMATVEAMGAGLVVILPPSMATTFGDGAVYCEPGEVQQLIDELWADPDAYTAQSTRAIRTVQERFGEPALLARIEHYLQAAGPAN